MPLHSYPDTHQAEQVDHYHGISVADPYRWLEDPSSPETKAWIEAQNQVTFAYLQDIPVRESIRQRITTLWNYEKYGTPFKKENRYFYFKNDGLQNQSVLYTLPSLEAEPRELLNPNTLSEDGTIALSGLAISENARFLAYGLSTAGSDWQEWKVRDVETGEDLEDHLQWIKFSGASWTDDHQGFFYSRYDEPNEANKLEQVNYFQKLYYHRLGTSQLDDVLVYERPDEKEWGFSGSVTEDGRYLIVTVWKGTDSKNLLFYKDLSDLASPMVELIHTFEASYNFIDNDGSTFWIQTDLEAPRGRVVAIDLTNPDAAHWQELIPEAEETLEGVGLLNNQFMASYLKDAHTQVKVFNLDGSFVRNVTLPGLGSAGGFGGKRYDTET
ncbi:S9 family peptidase, partial [filamentous cyanobacterium CCP1]